MSNDAELRIKTTISADVSGATQATAALTEEKIAAQSAADAMDELGQASLHAGANAEEAAEGTHAMEGGLAGVIQRVLQTKTGVNDLLDVFTEFERGGRVSVEKVGFLFEEIGGGPWVAALAIGVPLLIKLVEYFEAAGNKADDLKKAQEDAAIAAERLKTDLDDYANIDKTALDEIKDHFTDLEASFGREETLLNTHNSQLQESIRLESQLAIEKLRGQELNELAGAKTDEERKAIKEKYDGLKAQTSDQAAIDIAKEKVKENEQQQFLLKSQLNNESYIENTAKNEKQNLIDTAAQANNKAQDLGMFPATFGEKRGSYAPAIEAARLKMAELDEKYKENESWLEDEQDTVNLKGPGADRTVLDKWIARRDRILKKVKDTEAQILASTQAEEANNTLKKNGPEIDKTIAQAHADYLKHSDEYDKAKGERPLLNGQVENLELKKKNDDQERADNQQREADEKAARQAYEAKRFANEADLTTVETELKKPGINDAMKENLLMRQAQLKAQGLGIDKDEKQREGTLSPAEARYIDAKIAAALGTGSNQVATQQSKSLHETISQSESVLRQVAAENPQDKLLGEALKELIAETKNNPQTEVIGLIQLLIRAHSETKDDQQKQIDILREQLKESRNRND